MQQNSLVANKKRDDPTVQLGRHRKLVETKKDYNFSLTHKVRVGKLFFYFSIDSTT